MDPCIPRRGQSGQASVAFVATLPAVVGAAIVLVQCALIGYAAWAAVESARAAARAELVGADPGRAARAALPGALRGGAEVGTSGGRARVEVPSPRVLPFLPRLTLTASAGLEPAADEGG